MNSSYQPYECLSFSLSSVSEPLSVFSYLAAPLINSSHTCTSVSVPPSPLLSSHYIQSMHCMNQCPRNNHLYSSSLIYLFFCSSTRFAKHRHQKKVIIWRKDDENHNKSFISAVPRTSLGLAGRTFWSLDLELILFREKHGRKSLSLTETKRGSAA